MKFSKELSPFISEMAKNQGMSIVIRQIIYKFASSFIGLPEYVWYMVISLNFLMTYVDARQWFAVFNTPKDPTGDKLVLIGYKLFLQLGIVLPLIQLFLLSITNDSTMFQLA